MRDGAVRFETRDGVDLAADVYRAEDRDVRPAGAILLHMIPPGNNRSNYSAEFIEALTERGFDVVNVDRRGAGGSLGVAREAYEGPNGWLDAEAAYDELAAEACPGVIGADPGRIVIVGASNGTTTALDWTVERSRMDVAGPAGVVFLTGGNYTENQQNLDDVRGVIEGVPILFMFSTAERAWSASHNPADGLGAEGEGEGAEEEEGNTPSDDGASGHEAAPAGWRFMELDPGGHGTRMFAVRPEAMTLVAEWMAEQVVR